MKRKNVIADHGEAASNFFPVRIVVVDSDKKSLKENVTILQKFPEIYEVTKCDKTYQVLTWLETDRSEFGIILIGECLLAANKLKLLQIGNERDLAVLVTSADGGIDTITRTIDDGACAYLPKPIPEPVLERVWTYAYSKRKDKLAQIQKPTDDASEEKKPRLKWTGDLKEKVAESVIEAGGIKEAKPKDILERLRARGIQDKSITRDKVSSYLQKERDRAKNKKDTIDESLDETFNKLPNLDKLPTLDGEVILEDSSLHSNKSCPTGNFENYTEDEYIELTMKTISEMIPSHKPGYQDKEGTSSEHVESRYETEEHTPITLPHLNTTNPNQQGFNLPLPVEANTSCTIGGQPFVDYWPENFPEEFDSIDASLSLPNECRPVEIIENYTGNDIAHEHSDNLLFDDNFSVDNYFVDDDLLTPQAAGLPER